MKTHYRRISKTALANFIRDLTTDGVKPSEYNALGSVGAVRVGTETTGYAVVQVVGEDRDGLPGAHCSDSFGGLKNAAREAVHHCRVRVTEEDPETGEPVVRIKLKPENDLPPGLSRFPDWAEGEPPPLIPEEGDAILAVGINPHRFI